MKLGSDQLTTKLIPQASFLRRKSRSSQRSPHETMPEQADIPEIHLQPHDTNHDCAGSEPTERLSFSTPVHLRSNQRLQLPQLFKRSVSDADSRLPRASDRPYVSSKKPDDSSELVETRGLSVLYSPTNPDLDFVFIHGLGGSSLKTWSFARQTRNFWPLWLHREPELAGARILTFGYNADFRGPSTILNIADFAKDLLFRMLTFEGKAKDGSKTRMGEVRHPVEFAYTTYLDTYITPSTR